MRCGEILKKASKKGDMILVYDHQEPEVLYYADRKEWHINDDHYSISALESKRSEGARYFATVFTNFKDTNRKLYEYLIKNYILINKEGCIIFNLNK